MLIFIEVLPDEDVVDEIQGSVTLDFEARGKSRQRLVLDDGTESALWLSRGSRLQGGDLLRSEENLIIKVITADEPISTLRAEDQTLTMAAYHLGNRHAIIQIGDGWLRYRQDHVLDGMMQGLDLKPTHESVPFEPEPGAYSLHDHLTNPLEHERIHS